MNMTDLKARIEAAYKAGVAKDGSPFTADHAQRAHQAIYAPTRYGKKMTPRDRDSILTHRFGI